MIAGLAEIHLPRTDKCFAMTTSDWPLDPFLPPLPHGLLLSYKWGTRAPVLPGLLGLHGKDEANRGPIFLHKFLFSFV